MQIQFHTLTRIHDGVRMSSANWPTFVVFGTLYNTRPSLTIGSNIHSKFHTQILIYCLLIIRTEDGSPRRTGAEDIAKTIRLATYNIRNGRNGGLEAALRAMAQANVDLGVFQETKLTEGI